MQNESIKNKTKNTILEKYGVENPSQIQDAKDKKIKTTLEHYDAINPFNIDSVKEKSRTKAKRKGKHKKFYFKKYSSLYKTGKIIDFNNGLITIHCNNCNNTSTIDKENVIKLLLKEIKNMDNNWQQISLLEAKFFTQSGKFRAVQEIDPFAMEEQKFLLKENNNIRFKFKMVMSDPAKYYIYPIVDGNPATVEKLKEVAGITEI